MTQAIGIPLMGWARDQRGSWDLGLGVVVTSSLIAVWLVMRVRLPARD